MVVVDILRRGADHAVVIIICIYLFIYVFIHLFERLQEGNRICLSYFS